MGVFCCPTAKVRLIFLSTEIAAAFQRVDAAPAVADACGGNAGVGDVVHDGCGLDAAAGGGDDEGDGDDGAAVAGAGGLVSASGAAPLPGIEVLVRSERSGHSKRDWSRSRGRWRSLDLGHHRHRPHLLRGGIPSRGCCCTCCC